MIFVLPMLNPILGESIGNTIYFVCWWGVLRQIQVICGYNNECDLISLGKQYILLMIIDTLWRQHGM